MPETEPEKKGSLTAIVGDVRSAVVSLLVGLLFAVLIALDVASLRTRIGDFLTADVQVWHLLMTLAIFAAAAAVGFRFWYGTQAFVTAKETGAKYPLSPQRKKLDWGGAKWRIDSADDVEGPFCTDDETFLARYLGTHGKPEARRPESDAWVDLGDRELRFVCLKCDREYNLTGNGDFETLTNIVLSLAQEPMRLPRV